MANILDISTITGINQVGNSYQRKNPIPLDYYSFFNTRVDAETYAATNAVAYVGQVIAFKESATNNAIKVCVITNEAGDLEALNNVEVKVPGIKQGTYITVTTDDNGDYTIAHAEAAAMTVTPETEKKTTFVTEITRDAQGHITGYKTSTVDVTLDELSIDRIPEGYENTGAIEIKGFHAQTENGLIPQLKIEGEGEDLTRTLEWVSVQEAIAGIEDKDTVTGVTAGNDGVIVALTTPSAGDDRTYSIKHKEKPLTDDEGIFEVEADLSGISGSYVTNVQIDEYGHVAGVTVAVDKDTLGKNVVGASATAITNGEATNGNVYLNHIENDQVVSTHKLAGSNGISVTSDAEGNIDIKAPSVSLTINPTIEDPEEGLVDVVNQFSQRSSHTIYADTVRVATKEYVDRVASGATDYLGTVGTAEQLAALNPGKGDFVRVSTAFGDYHASDMLICETPKDGENAAIWSVIHGEIDQNTWVANTKDADGYVTKGEGEVKKVWATDSEQNPGWSVAYDTAASADTLAQRQSNGQLTVVETPVADTDAASKKYVDDAKAEALAAIPTVNDGQFTVSGTGYLTGSGSMTADQKDDTTATLDLTEEAKALLAKAGTAIQPNDLPTVNDGQFTVSGTGYLTGSGSMTANQAGNTTASLDLTAEAKALLDNAVQPDDLKDYVPTKELDNLMKLQLETEEGNYAIFDAQGQAVDGGKFYFYADSVNSADASEQDRDGGSIGFQLKEKYDTTDYVNGKIIAEMHIDVASDSGLEVIDAGNISGTSDDSVFTSGKLALSSATKESLEKADSAIQEITTKCTNTTHSHTTTCGGLKATKTDSTVNIEIDDSITFILNCGSAADLL